MNKFIGIGNLGRDPEVRTTQSGKMVAQFSIGIQDGYGEKKSTTWLNIVCWEKLAETAGNFLHKGSKILVEGKVNTRSYEAKDGQKKYVTEIIASGFEFLTPKPAQTDAASEFGQDVHPDDEIPF